MDRKPMDRQPLVLILTLFLLLCLPLSSYAQDYSFSLGREVVDVWINDDGSVSLEYAFTFTCDAGAHPIDAVDVGLPTGDYRLSDMSANVDGKPVDRIDTDYQGSGAYGVAVWLGSATIRPGQTGTVNVAIDRVGGMVYEDRDDTEYASSEFSPTWFMSQFVHDTTDMTVHFQFVYDTSEMSP